MSKKGFLSNFLFYVLLFLLIGTLFICMWFNLEDSSDFTYAQMSTIFSSLTNIVQNYTQAIVDLQFNYNQDLYHSNELQLEIITSMNQNIQNVLIYFGGDDYLGDFDPSNSQSWNDSFYDSLIFILGQINNFIQKFSLLIPAFFVSLGYYMMMGFDFFMGIMRLIYTVFSGFGDLLDIYLNLLPS